MTLEKSSFSATLEAFREDQLSADFSWFNPPPRCTVAAGVLCLETGHETDFWQKTQYGFSADNGHFLYLPVRGDFNLTCQVSWKPNAQYDQAGLMVRCSSACWLKTSVEFETSGPDKLGAVITNGARSDWSKQDFVGDDRSIRLQVTRLGGDYIVGYSLPRGRKGGFGPWQEMRVGFLQEDRAVDPVQCGLYACSPKGKGFQAHFSFLRIETAG